MARQQPMAGDLRFLTGAIKINSDLERMGDLACNVAKQAWRLNQDPYATFAERFVQMAERVRRMVTGSMDALLTRNVALAREIWALDAEVDVQFGRLLDHCFELMRDQHVTPQDATTYVAAARNVERIGDHATNITEDVVFIVEGRIVRHNVEARIAPRPPSGL
jgi:phosphate transport system protein